MRLQTYMMTGLLACTFLSAPAQQTSLGATPARAPRRVRLILKDGSYQVVLSYKVTGKRVSFVSAERNGEREEIPLELVDLPATQRWEAQHTPADPQQQAPPVLDPELLKEEAGRAALSPEVAQDLRLAPEDAVLALDTFHGSPELVPMNQAESQLNRQTGHNVLRSAVNPRAASHQILVLKGEKADVQMHVSQPEIYLRLDDAEPSTGGTLTVDTHGAGASEPSRRTPSVPSQYVVVRVEVRQDARVVASFDTQYLGASPRTQQDVVETEMTPLPGGHWLKIVPKQPLLMGEYALVELLNERELNLSVWDFGVHPTAPENRDALHPEKRRPTALERRTRN